MPLPKYYGIAKGWSVGPGQPTSPAPVLATLSLAAAAFTQDAAAGTVIGAIQGLTTGSTIAVFPNDGRVTIDNSNNLVVGLTTASVGSFNITLRETLGGAQNSPNSTTVTVTVNAASAGITSGNLVANRFQVPTVRQTTPSLPWTNRRQHHTSRFGAVSNLQCVDICWAIDGSYTEQEAASAFTIKRYIEYPAGTFTQVTWSGATSVTVPLGVTPAVSDPLPITIPADTKYWERTVVTAAGANLPCVELPAAPAAIGVDDGFVQGSDLGNSGTISPHAVAVYTYGAVAMIGDVAAANARSGVFNGDSIIHGKGDTTGCGARGGSGYLGRVFDPLMPYLKVAREGQSAANLLANTTHLQGLLAAIGYTDAVCEHLINDIAGGSPQANWQTNVASIANILKKGGSTIAYWQTTCTDRTDSTDGWTTVAGQTVRTDSNWGARALCDAWTRTRPAHINGGFIEVADKCSTARDSGIYIITGAGVSSTADGSHPSTPLAAAIAANVVFGFEFTTPTSKSVAEHLALAIPLETTTAATVAITGGVDAGRFQISGTTLQWVGNGSQTFASPLDANGDNVYSVQVTATETATGATSTKTLNVTVTQAAITYSLVYADDFTDTALTALTAHTPTGTGAAGTWTLSTGAVLTPQISNANAVRHSQQSGANNNTTCLGTIPLSGGVKSVAAEALFKFLTNNSSTKSTALVVGSTNSTTSETHIAATYTGSAIAIQQRIAGALTTLASYGLTMSANTTVRLELDKNADNTGTWRLIVNGAQAASGTVTAANMASLGSNVGIRFVTNSNAGSDTTGVHIDNFKAYSGA